MRCTCRGQLHERCHDCQANERARRRMADNALLALARNFAITDPTWHRVIWRHEVDDLHLLLLQEN